MTSLGPPILKFCSDRCVWAPQYLAAGLMTLEVSWIAAM